MREIKFRGRTTKGEWIYGDLVRNEDGRVAIVPPLKGDGNDFHQWEVEPETVGQYTGLKDEDGVEIYDGDVLTRVGTVIHHRTVYWNEYHGAWLRETISLTVIYMPQ